MDDFLMHYGRKGMKWYQHIYGEVQSGAKYAQKGSSGVQTTKGQIQSSKKSVAKESKKENAKPEIKRIEDLTDDELRRMLNRAQMEKQLRDLQPKKVSVGQEIVNRILLPVLEQQAKNFLNAEIGKAVRKMTQDASKIETPKPQVSAQQNKPDLSKVAGQEKKKKK